MPSVPEVDLTLTGGRLLGPAGPLPAGAAISLRIDESGLTFVGGDPPTAWQIPYSAVGEPRCRRHRDAIEIAGWVAGTLVMATFPASALEEASAEEIDQVLAVATGRSDVAPGSPVDPRRPRRRRRPVLLVVAGVALLAAASLLVVQLRSSHARASARSDRAETAAMNLRAADLPSGWGAIDPAAAPLGGFLSTASTRQSPAQKRVSAAVIARYQRCMGIPDARDRVFGAAGVTPPIEIGGLPYGPEQSTALTEVGTVTQRYASPADVAADRRQIVLPQFPTCFAEAIGRLATADGDLSKASAALPVARQALRQPLGVLATGADVTIPMAGLTGSTPAQLGVTVLLTGPYEQTLYTLSVPGAFPADLRQRIVGELAARLSGIAGSRSA